MVLAIATQRVEAPEANGTDTVQVLPLPDWSNLSVTTVGANTATGSVEMTFSSAADIEADSADWVSLPQTHTVAEGDVTSHLHDSGFEVSPTAIRVTRTAGEIVLSLTGKQRVID